MHKASTVSNSEWIIMELLWVRPYTLMELVNALCAPTGWSKSTVATMIRRMTQKGIVNYTEKGRTKIFAPTVTRDGVALEQTHSLLQRAYHGKVSRLVASLAQENTLTAADIAELHTVLKDAEEALK